MILHKGSVHRRWPFGGALGLIVVYAGSSIPRVVKRCALPILRLFLDTVPLPCVSLSQQKASQTQARTLGIALSQAAGLSTSADEVW